MATFQAAMFGKKKSTEQATKASTKHNFEQRKRVRLTKKYHRYHFV